MVNADAPPDSTEERTKPVVLIVEDELLVRLTAAEFLRDAGLTVVEAANAAEAIAVVASQTPVDLVFTDIQMPGPMDGRRLANWLGTQRPTLPVLMTSTLLWHPSEAGETRRFVAKPYSLSEIERHIRELLACGNPL